MAENFFSNQASSSSIMGYQSLAFAVSFQAAKAITEFYLNPMLAGVILHIEKYTKSLHSEVSKKKLINSSGQKNIVTDNIAPEIFIWSIEGRIKAELYEFTNRIVPSLKRKQQILENACFSRQPIIWRDVDSYTHQVGIEDIEFLTEPDNQNTLHFNATIVQVNTLTTIQALTSIKEEKANSVAGSGDGKASNVGATQVKDNKTMARKLIDKGGITPIIENLIAGVGK
jgi:hypothetical protein